MKPLRARRMTGPPRDTVGRSQAQVFTTGNDRCPVQSR